MREDHPGEFHLWQNPCWFNWSYPRTALLSDESESSRKLIEKIEEIHPQEESLLVQLIISLLCSTIHKSQSWSSQHCSPSDLFFNPEITKAVCFVENSSLCYVFKPMTKFQFLCPASCFMIDYGCCEFPELYGYQSHTFKVMPLTLWHSWFVSSILSSLWLCWRYQNSNLYLFV